MFANRIVIDEKNDSATAPTTPIFPILTVLRNGDMDVA